MKFYLFVLLLLLSSCDQAMPSASVEALERPTGQPQVFGITEQQWLQIHPEGVWLFEMLSAVDGRPIRVWATPERHWFFIDALSEDGMGTPMFMTSTSVPMMDAG